MPCSPPLKTPPNYTPPQKHKTTPQGPAGSSVREIMRRTGADIKSWTEASGGAGGKAKRPARIFLVGVRAN